MDNVSAFATTDFIVKCRPIIDIVEGEVLCDEIRNCNEPEVWTHLKKANGHELNARESIVLP